MNYIYLYRESKQKLAPLMRTGRIVINIAPLLSTLGDIIMFKYCVVFSQNTALVAIFVIKK